MSENMEKDNINDIAAENTNHSNSANLSHAEAENVCSPPTADQILIEEADAEDGNIGQDNKSQNKKQSEPTDAMRDDECPTDSRGDNNDSANATDLNVPDTEIRDSNTDKGADDNTCTEDVKNELRNNNIVENNLELKVDLPELESKPSNTSDNALSSVEGACASNDAVSNTANDTESIHQIKWIYFKNKQVPIITQNENGPCPLLALINVLLLQNRITLTAKAEIVSAGQLMAHLGDCVLQNVPGEEGVSTPSRLNFEQNMGDAMAVMYKLQTGLDVNVRFTGVRDFEYTSECIIFDLLQIALYHGWLVDPQNVTEVEAVGKCSYNQLVEKIIVQKSSDQPNLVSEALVAEQFLESSASQLTYHGLSELCTQLKEDELAVLFRNNHFTTLYRHKGELFQLVTDQGFLNESNVVWETLSNVEGDCHFVDCEFRTYTKPDTPPLPVPPVSVPVNSEEQIDHDYLIALSLQQEQQQQQQPSDSNWLPQNTSMSDEELAKQLQEEERQAAMAEANAPRRQGQQPPRQQQQHSQQSAGQRRSDRPQRRDEKKSDCCIL